MALSDRATATASVAWLPLAPALVDPADPLPHGRTARRHARRPGGRRPWRTAGHPRPRLPRGGVVVATPAARPRRRPATTPSRPISAATADRPAPPRSRRTASRRLAGDLHRAARRDRAGAGRVRGPRLGRADRVGPRPAAPRAGAGRRRRRACRSRFWPARPTDVLRGLVGDRFFYILYFQQVGPAERELEADPRATACRRSCGARRREGFHVADEMPPVEGTGFLTGCSEPPPLPWPWLTEADLDHYVSSFEAVRLLRARSATTGTWTPTTTAWSTCPPSRLTMPSCLIVGDRDVGLADDRRRSRAHDRRAAGLPGPDHHPGRRALDAAGGAAGLQRRAAHVPGHAELTRPLSPTPPPDGGGGSAAPGRSRPGPALARRPSAPPRADRAGGGGRPGSACRRWDPSSSPRRASSSTRTRPAPGSVGHGHRHGPVEGHHGRGSDAGEDAVERGDLGPVRRLPRWARWRGARRSRPPAGTDRCGGGRGPARPAPRPSSIWRRSQRERSWSARRTRSPSASSRPSRRASCSSIRRGQPLHLRLVGHEGAQHANQPDGLGAELAPDELIAGRGRVALVEHQVDARGARRRGARPAAPRPAR